jgi:hypothetical protein
VHASYPVPPHTEQAFSRIRPGILGFLCIVPALRGGETPLFDAFGAYQSLSSIAQEQLKDCMFEKQVINLDLGGQMTHFGTTDRSAIQSVCSTFRVTPTWRGERLSFSMSGPCTIMHPFHNKTALCGFWTATSLYYFFRQYKNYPGVNPFMTHVCRIIPGRLFETVAKAIHPYFRKRYRYRFNKGGSPARVPFSILHEMQKVIWSNTTLFKWKPGDVLLVDNIAVGHARMPYTGNRMVAAGVYEYYDTDRPWRCAMFRTD